MEKNEIKIYCKNESFYTENLITNVSNSTKLIFIFKYTGCARRVNTSFWAWGLKSRQPALPIFIKTLFRLDMI